MSEAAVIVKPLDPVEVLRPVNLLHAITSKVEALTEETVLDVRSKVGLLRGLRIVDATSLAAADDAYSKARKLRAAIEEQRKTLKRPVLDLEDAIDAAAKPALQLLDAEIAKARSLIDGWNAEQQRKHAAEQKRLAEEAEKLRREEEARAAAAAKKLEEERAAAAAAAESLNDMFGDAVAEPPAPAPAPAAPLMARTVSRPAQAPAPILSKTVTSRTEMRLQIDSPAEVPIEMEGEVLVEFKDAAITRLLRRGVKVPGCRLVPVTSPTTKA